LYAKNEEITSTDAKRWISMPALEGAPSQLSTIKMTDFFAVNLNARLDRNGKLAADSDGDGLSDQEELELSQKLGLQLKPDQARSNGVCLDVMMVNPAYTQACRQAQATNICDPNIDMDGDGVNETDLTCKTSGPTANNQYPSSTNPTVITGTASPCFLRDLIMVQNFVAPAEQIEYDPSIQVTFGAILGRKSTLLSIRESTDD
jgi:hypothetical protein